MKKIASAALLSLFTVATPLLYPQVAKADRVVYCNSATGKQVSKNSVHSNAYADGYREGQQKARDREAYKPRTEGGEFARGFEDGYFNRRYNGPVYVPERTEQSTNQRCNESSSSVIVTPPTVIYSSPYPYYGYPYPYYGYPYYNYPSTFLNFNFGFGGWGRYGYGHRGWGRYGRW